MHTHVHTDRKELCEKRVQPKESSLAVSVECDVMKRREQSHGHGAPADRADGGATFRGIRHI